MKALPLTQPWATLMALGKKHYETRSWSTNYRGLVAITASCGFPRACRELCDIFPFNQYVPDPDILPRGKIVAVGELFHVHSTEVIAKDLRGQAVFFKSGGYLEELQFGDYSPGRFAWKFINIQPLKTPVDVCGNLGLWNLDEETEKMVLLSL